MAKGEARNTNRFVDSERDQLNQEHGRFTNSQYDALPGARGRANKTFDRAFSGYDDFLGNVRSLGGGGRGYGDIEGRYRDFADTGGINDEGMQRIRGKGVFDEFARTGGLSEADKTNIRARGTATIPSFFENLKNNLDRSKAAQGGYNPGYTAQAAEMARDSARGAQDAALEAETGITDRVNQGRMWGAGSLSSAEQGLQELLSRNKMAGMEGMFNARNAGSRDALQAAGLELGGLEGLRGLRTDVPGEESALFDRILASIGQRGGLVGDNLKGRMAYNPNKSMWDRFMDIAGAAGPIAGAFMGPGGTKAGGPSGLPPQTDLYRKFYGG